VGDPLYGKLTGSLRALSVAVKAFTCKLESCELSAKHSDQRLELISSSVLRIEQNTLKIISQQVQQEKPVAGMTKKSRMERDMSDVTQNLAARTTPKKNDHHNGRSNLFDDFNTTIHMPIEITKDDDEWLIRGTAGRPATAHWKPAKASYRKVNNKCKGEQQTLISSKGPHFTPGGAFNGGITGSHSTREPLLGRPAMLFSNSTGLGLSTIGGKVIEGTPTNMATPRATSFSEMHAFNSHRIPGSEPIGTKPMETSTVKLFDTVLSELQISVATYAFNPQGEAMEDLVKFEDCVLKRHHITTLRPDAPTFWCLPLSFAADIQEGKDTHQLLQKYKDPWMKGSSTLNYAYIPLREPTRHWYLMVIGFRERILYHLDASMTEEESIRRKAVIRFVGNEVSCIIAAPHFPLEFLKTAGGVICFGISDASGLPSFQTRAASEIWVLNWMAMGGAFQHNLHPQMNDSMVRMHTVLGLLMSPFNESTEWMKKNESTV
ncbi:hypothetical protein S245_071061, partial [Arachis hypogaea]